MNLLNVLLAALAGCAASEGALLDTHGMYGLGETHHYEVRPETVDQRYHIYVRLPEDYTEAPQARYPVVYILDGGLMYPLLSAFREPALAWMEAWNAADHRPWTLQTVTLDGDNHFSAAPAAFRQGMRWLFGKGD